MRAVVQRVKEARVRIEGKTMGEIGRGLLVLVGVGATDTAEDAIYLGGKIADLRLFSDSEGKMNLSIRDVPGAFLVVSQFTLYGDCRKGRRPSYTDSAPPEQAIPLYGLFVQRLRETGLPVATGTFGAMMDVELINDGPVTLLLDSKKIF